MDVDVPEILREENAPGQANNKKVLRQEQQEKRQITTLNNNQIHLPLGLLNQPVAQRCYPIGTQGRECETRCCDLFIVGIYSHHVHTMAGKDSNREN